MAATGKKQITLGLNVEVNKKALNDLTKTLDEVIEKGNILMEAGGDYAEPYREATVAAKDMKKALVDAYNVKLGKSDITKVKSQIESLYGSMKHFETSISQIGPIGQKAFNQFSHSIATTNIELKKSQTLLDKMAITFGNTIRYGISSSVFNNFTNSIAKAYNYVEKLDKSLNRIRIVSNQTTKEMEKFAVQANKISQSLGNTTLDYTNAALIYYQQGLNIDEIEKRTEVTLKMANALGSSASEVSDYMTAIWNNFQKGSESLEYFADVITALGAATASSAEEISEGLEKFAAVADTVGLSYEYATTALATVVAETRQSADTVGTAFKTLFARIQGLNLGETLDDGVTLNKYSKALEAVGINILNQNNELKDMNDILNEMGSKWQTIDKSQRVALAQTIAGTRQYTQLVALMDNWGEFQANLAVAQNASGTLERQQEIYLDSIEAKTNAIEATWESIANEILDEKLIKGSLDLFKNFIGTIENFVKGLGGGLNTITYLAGAITTAFSPAIAKIIGDISHKTAIQRREVELYNKDLEVLKNRLNEVNDAQTRYSEDSQQYRDLEIEKEELDIQLKLAKYSADLEEEEREKYKASLEYNNVLKDRLKIIEDIITKEQGDSDRDKIKNALVANQKRQKEVSNYLMDKGLQESIASGNHLGSSEDMRAFFTEHGALAEKLLSRIKEIKEEKEKASKVSTISKEEENILKDEVRELEKAIKLLEEKEGFEENDNQYARLTVEKNLLDQAESAEREMIDLKEKEAFLQDTLNQGIQTTIESIKKEKNEQEDILNIYEQKTKNIESVQAILSAIGGLLTSISAIRGAFDTLFNNDTMTPLEKFESVSKVLVVQAGILLATYKSIRQELLKQLMEENGVTTLKALQVKLGEKSLLVAAKDLILAKARAIWESIIAAIKNANPIGLALAAVAALTAAVIGIIKWYQKWGSEQAKLDNQLKDAKENYKKINEEVQKNLDLFSQYKNARKNIDSLTEGTVEYYQAVMEANKQAEELIEKYNLIAGKEFTTSKSGLIQIDDDILASKMFQETQRLYKAQGEVLQAKYAKLEYEQKNIVNDFKNVVNNRNSIRGGITSETARDILGGTLNETQTKENEYSSKVQLSQWEDVKSMIHGGVQDIKDSTIATGLAIVNPIGTLSAATAVQAIEQAKIGEEVQDITEEVGQYRGDYNRVSAEMLELQRQMAQTYIQGLGKEEDVKEYRGLLSDQRKSIEDYVSKTIQANSKEGLEGIEAFNDSLESFWDTSDSGWFTGGLINGLKTVISLIPGAGQIFGVQRIASSIDRANKKQTDLDIKKDYAKYVNKWRYDESSGKWYDEDNKEISEKDIKNIDLKKAKQARDSGIYSTEKALETIIKRRKTSIEASKASGIIDNSSRQYIADAVLAVMGGSSDYDFNALTTGEWEEAKKQIGEALIQEGKSEDTELWKQQMATWREFLQATPDEAVRAAKDLNKYTEVLDNYAKELETTTSALRLYSIASQNADKGIVEYTEDTAEAAAAEYKFNKTFNEGRKAFEKNQDAWNLYTQSLKNGTKVSYDVADSAGEIVESLKNMGITLTDDQLKSEETLALVEQLFTGTEEAAEEAYNKLKEQGWINSFISDLGIAKDAAQELFDLINNTQIGNDVNLETLTGKLGNVQKSLEDWKAWAEQYGLDIEIPDGTVSEYSTPSQKILSKHTISAYRDSKGQWVDGYEYYETEEIPGKKLYALGQLQVRKVSTGNTSFTPSGLGGSTGSNKEPKRLDLSEEEADRYHKVNTQITKTDNLLKKLQSQQDKFFGSKLINNLQTQWELLNKQIENYSEKLRIANEEQIELANKLTKKGVTFNPDGTISNYVQSFNAQRDYVNNLKRQYNSLSAAQQEVWDNNKTIDNAEKEFDKFKENLDRYDELVSDFIPQLQQSVQDAVDQQIENKIQQFNYEITIRLDLAEAEKQWNEFKKKVIDEIKDSDILGNARARLTDFDIYYKDNGKGSIQAQTKHLQELLAEFAKQNSDAATSLFKDNQQKALENLKQYQEQLMQDLEEIVNIQNDIYDSFLNMLDEAQEKFNEQISSYELITSILEHDMNLIRKVYGEDSYEMLSKYYEKQQENNNNQLDFHRQEMEFWKARMDLYEEDSEEWVKARDNWKSALEAWQSDIEKSLENIRAKFENEINIIFKKLNDKLTRGQGLEYVNEQWTLINKNADQYLDTINAVTGLRNLESKYVDAINKTDNTDIQRKLNKLMESELNGLKAKDKLTQYDLDRAEKRYNLYVAQIALEEAQQNKSQMRLRRDSQGNYSYQFVADDASVQEAQDNLRSMYQDLYNFDKDRYLNNLNDIYSTWDEYQQKMAAVALINDPQQRAEREALIQEQYGELINGLVQQNEDVRLNLHESAFEDLANLYNQDLEAYTNLTNAEQDVLLNSLIPQWTSGVQQMVDVFIGEGGFEQATSEAMAKVSEVTDNYTKDLEELQTTANKSFEDVKNGIDANIDATQSLVNSNTELINTYDEEIKKVSAVVEEFEKLRQKYAEIESAAKEAVKATQELRAATMEEEADKVEVAEAAAQEASNQASLSANQGTAAGNSSIGTNGGDGVARPGDMATFLGGSYYNTSYGGTSGSRGAGRQVRITEVVDDGRPYPVHVVSSDSAYGWLKLSQLSGYDTGGYTGDWGSKNGRLALLHQKELVLNSNDTENLLDAVSIMRNITSSLNSTLFSRLAGTTASSINSEGGNGLLEQNVRIEATFPNVKNSQEIENALMNLVNVAAQRVQEDR